jgi:hypothetical protein
MGWKERWMIRSMRLEEKRRKGRTGSMKMRRWKRRRAERMWCRGAGCKRRLVKESWKSRKERHRARRLKRSWRLAMMRPLQRKTISVSFFSNPGGIRKSPGS